MYLKVPFLALKDTVQWTKDKMYSKNKQKMLKTV